MQTDRLEINKRIERISYIQNSMGKLPPQALELEEALLGSILLNKESFGIASEIITSECFYKDSHQKIFKACENMFNKSQPIDLLTVPVELRLMGDLEMIGGAYALVELTSYVSREVDIEFCARIIYQKFLQREMIRVSTETISQAYEDTTDVFDLIEKNQSDVFGLAVVGNKKEILGIDSLVTDCIDYLKTPSVNGLTGIGTGFKDIDKVTGGWQNSDLIIIAARPAMGKCLGKGTNVIMFDGSIKKVEDVLVGDKLMGVDSTPRNVLSLARGREQMYWVRQNKGIDYRVNESHILSLKRSGTQGQTKHGSILNIPLKEYLSQSNKFKTRNKGYKVGVEFSEKIVEIDPYFLGLWLGDGKCSNQSISNPDIEIINYLQSMADKMDMNLTNYKFKDKCPLLSIVKKCGSNNKVIDILRNINVLDNKHIPDNFLLNSRKNRLLLLAGLVDTDGFYDKNHGVVEIIQVNKKLSQQIKYLCHTLGLACTIKEVTKGIKSRNFTGQYYRLIISGDLHLIPTKIKRKQATKSINKRNVLVTGIKVEKDILDDYYGFTIDGDRLFLLEDCTVTHNTAFVLNVAKNACLQYNVPTLFFSLEMSAKQLTHRIVADESNVMYERIKHKTLSFHEVDVLQSDIKKLSQSKLFIDDTPTLNPYDFRVKARRMKQKHGIGLIVIDYLQLMEGGIKSKQNGNREQEISQISRSLKQVAKELDIPVIALSQLSRAVESRQGGSKRPQLSDLRESGSIEQDADMVGFLYRPEYYNILEDAEGRSTVGLCELIFQKNRAGVCDTVKLDFNGAYMRFKDWNEGYVPPSNFRSLVEPKNKQDDEDRPF